MPRVKESWAKITSEMVAKSFRKTGISLPLDGENDDEFNRDSDDEDVAGAPENNPDDNPEVDWDDEQWQGTELDWEMLAGLSDESDFEGF